MLLKKKICLSNTIYYITSDCVYKYDKYLH
jgi:hypothetical protein